MGASDGIHTSLTVYITVLLNSVVDVHGRNIYCRSAVFHMARKG